MSLDTRRRAAEVAIEAKELEVVEDLKKILAKEMKSGDLKKAKAVDLAIKKLLSKPRVYRDEHEGTAGGTSVDNQYEFDVVRAAESAKLVIRADHPGHDTGGVIIWMVPGDEEGREIGKWSGSDENPIEIEIPEGIMKTGLHKVYFKFTGGNHALQVRSVILHTE